MNHSTPSQKRKEQLIPFCRQLRSGRDDWQCPQYMVTDRREGGSNPTRFPVILDVQPLAVSAAPDDLQHRRVRHIADHIARSELRRTAEFDDVDRAHVGLGCHHRRRRLAKDDQRFS